MKRGDIERYPLFFYAYPPCESRRVMHSVVPSVVAMAVRMVMTVCRIFCQSSFLFIVSAF